MKKLRVAIIGQGRSGRNIHGAFYLSDANTLFEVACVVDADAELLHRVEKSTGCLCVIGNEGNGRTAATIAACKKRVTIPMAGRAESLNASMAAGIAMWEMTRPE